MKQQTKKKQNNEHVVESKRKKRGWRRRFVYWRKSKRKIKILGRRRADGMQMVLNQVFLDNLQCVQTNILIFLGEIAWGENNFHLWISICVPHIFDFIAFINPFKCVWLIRALISWINLKWLYYCSIECITWKNSMRTHVWWLFRLSQCVFIRMGCDCLGLSAFVYRQNLESLHLTALMNPNASSQALFNHSKQ